MRIAVTNWTRSLIGGTEGYVQAVIEALAARGMQVALLTETQAGGGSQISVPSGVAEWCVQQHGAAAALEGLRQWKPDLIYGHGLHDHNLGHRVLDLAPGVFFAHNYHGICISGTKTFTRPEIEACHRPFGLGCLACYYPRRCGGLNPIVAVQLYRSQAGRLPALRRYARVITHSEYVAEEYRRNGLAADVISYAVDEPSAPAGDPGPLGDDVNLFFSARMDRLKGGETLLAALPAVAAALERRLQLVMAGDGPERRRWEDRARSVRSPAIDVTFTGWLERPQLERHLRDAHVAVVPSLWPEPFGKVGPEAGMQGVPVAAFDVGGVREWLRDGVNGHLAPGNPPTVDGLATAISKCVADAKHHNELRANCPEVASRFRMESHVVELTKIFEGVLSRRPARVGLPLAVDSPVEPSLPSVSGYHASSPGGLRIGVLCQFRRKMGGMESYLSWVLPALAAAGHTLALVCEHEGGPDRPLIPAPSEAPVWMIGELGLRGVLAELAAWKPDVLYVHGLGDPRIESQALALAPAVLMAHVYYGTCVSGTKTCRAPVAAPCERVFGPACLLHYYPKRCGGLNPVTMLKLYDEQRHRRKLLDRYRSIITFSEHMRDEFVRHGIAPERVMCIRPVVEPPAEPPIFDVKLPPETWRLLFSGRMEVLKGGALLMKSLADVRCRLGRPVHLTCAGDGPDRAEWERLAAAVSAIDPDVRVEFTGWIDRRRMDTHLRESHLVVVSSVWPEPFGLVGPEAGLAGVPAVAFAVGGIPSWLTEGANGHLAPADPPTAAGLADAIVRSLIDPEHYLRLRRGAAELARRFVDPVEHLHQLTAILGKAGARQAVPASA